jgi:hypothetical protein
VLAGCATSGPGMIGNQSTSFEDEVTLYSSRLIQRSKGSITKASAPERTSDMPSYAIRYTAVSPALLTSKDADINSSSYARNIGITVGWKQMFCRPELKKILKDFGVPLVAGRIYSEAGESSSIAVCSLE